MLTQEHYVKRLTLGKKESFLCSGFPAVLEGYSNANWISYLDEIKSTSRYVFTLGRGAEGDVTWKLTK